MTTAIANETTPISAMLTELRSIIDERERLAEQDKKLAARRSAIEAKLMNVHESQGIDSLASSGLSVSFDDEAMRAKYDPEQWQSIVKWAVETGHDYIVQRRLTDAKVLSLIQNGIALPPGLTVEPYVKISVRRT